MSTLWVYGCSFAAGHGVLGAEADDQMLNQTGRIAFPDHSFGKFCADELGMDSCLRALSGSSNFYILDQLINDIGDIQSDDTVVIMWTYPDRTMFTDEQENEYHMLAANSGFSERSRFYYETLYSDRRSKVETTSLICAANNLCLAKNARIVNTTFWQTQVKGLAWFYNRKLLNDIDISFPECMMYRTKDTELNFYCHDGYHPSLAVHKDYGVRLAQYIRDKYEQD